MKLRKLFTGTPAHPHMPEWRPLEELDEPGHCTAPTLSGKPCKLPAVNGDRCVLPSHQVLPAADA